MLMGRGEPAGLVIGCTLLGEFVTRAAEEDEQFADYLRSPDCHPFGLQLFVTTKYPETLFAVGANEIDHVQKHLMP